MQGQISSCRNSSTWRYNYDSNLLWFISSRTIMFVFSMINIFGILHRARTLKVRWKEWIWDEKNEYVNIGDDQTARSSAVYLEMLYLFRTMVGVLPNGVALAPVANSLLSVLGVWSNLLFLWNMAGSNFWVTTLAFLGSGPTWAALICWAWSSTWCREMCLLLIAWLNSFQRNIRLLYLLRNYWIPTMIILNEFKN